MRLGALEAGGTKMVCAIGNANGEIYERISIPTETPEITVPKMIEYFKERRTFRHWESVALDRST